MRQCRRSLRWLLPLVPAVGVALVLGTAHRFLTLPPEEPSAPVDPPLRPVPPRDTAQNAPGTFGAPKPRPADAPDVAFFTHDWIETPRSPIANAPEAADSLLARLRPLDDAGRWMVHQSGREAVQCRTCLLFGLIRGGL